MWNDEKEQRLQQIVTSFKPCAKLVNRTEDEKGRVSYRAVFEHTIVDGRCIRGGETNETTEEHTGSRFSICSATVTVIPNK